MYPSIQVFGFSLPAYGLLSLVGAGVGVLYALLTNRSGRVGKISGEDLLNIFCVALVGIVIGGKALGVLVEIPTVVQHWDYLSQQHWFETAKVLLSAFVFYGGLLGMLGAIWLYCRRYGLSYASVMGMLTPGIPLFHTFGRIGCFLAGCCYGVPAPWGIAFTRAPHAPNGVPLFPVQLVESGFNFLLFLALAVLSRRMKDRALLLPAYLLSYGVFRFVIEFFRGDEIRGVWLLSTSQWISLVLIAASAAYMVRRLRAGPPAPTATPA